MADSIRSRQLGKWVGYWKATLSDCPLCLVPKLLKSNEVRHQARQQPKLACQSNRIRTGTSVTHDRASERRRRRTPSMIRDLDDVLKKILADVEAPNELRAADISFQTPDRQYSPEHTAV